MSSRPAKRSLLLVLLASLALACAQEQPADAPADSAAAAAAVAAPNADPAADEAAIRARSAAWLAAQRAKNLDSIVAFLHDDVVAVYDGKLLSGRDAVRKDQEDAFAAAAKDRPDFQYSWETTGVGVSRGGDLAYESGRYDYSWGAGKSHDRGYFLTVWRKADGQWRVARDITAPDSASMRQR